MSTPLNIYYVKRTDDGEWGYDNFSDFVVICATSEEARNTHPKHETPNQGWKNSTSTWIPSSQKEELLNVTLVGYALPGSQPKVVCTSFHAG